jgi:membrane dipeptidase
MRVANSHRFFDAHLDLAYLAVNGRAMLAETDACGGPHLPASCTLPALAAGGVRGCLGTVFTEAGGVCRAGYPVGDVEAAHAAGAAQLEVYGRWAREGHIRLAGVSAGAAGAGNGGGAALAAGVLVECADPIRSPDELEWWRDRGVVAIGLAWARGSRYAAGNAEPSCSSDFGLTDLGLEMVRRMDALGIVHDLSHLSQRASDELLSRTDRPVVATHSNCRALLDGHAQRHLTDDTIREIARRGGIIGLNLFAPFVRHDLGEGERPSISEAVRHTEHVCEILGHRRSVGLGSDLDGGFSARQLPVGIESAHDLWKIAQTLASRGWSEEEVEGFTWGNWARFWRSAGVEFDAA